MYRASSGQIEPRKCLRRTLPEIIIILEEGNELFNERLILHADLKTSTLNAPHFQKRNQKPYEIEEMLPKDVSKGLKQEVRPEDQARWIKEKGDALAAKCKRIQHR